MPARTPLRPRFVLHGALAGCLLLAPTSALRAQSRPLPPTGTFPSLTAEALDKTTLTIPQQLEGRQNLILLSWARDQAPQVDTWTAVAQGLQHASFDFRVYRMLVSAPENTLFRWWDNASLRAEETDPGLLHWSVPLYTDQAALRRSLGLGMDDRSVIALLVDRSGHILWKAEGASTAAGRASLQEAAQATR